MNRRLMFLAIGLLLALAGPAGMAFGWQMAGRADQKGLASAASPGFAASVTSSPSTLAPSPAVTTTATVAATVTSTATRTATQARISTASPTLPPATPSIAPTGTATTTSVSSPSTTPTATATQLISPTPTPTSTPTVTATLPITIARSYRFQGTLETRRDGVLNATETFGGERSGEDYRYTAVYKDLEGTVSEAEYLLVGGKLYVRTASTLGGERVGRTLAEAPWRLVEGPTGTFPKEVVETAAKGAVFGQRKAAKDRPEVDLVEFRSEGRYAAGTAQVDRRTGRVEGLEARQEIAVSPAIRMVMSGTLSLSDFDRPVPISAPLLPGPAEVRR